MSQSTNSSHRVLFSARMLFQFLLLFQIGLVFLLWSSGATWRDGKAVVLLVVALLVSATLGEAVRRRFQFGRRVLVAALTVSVSIAALLIWQVNRVHQRRSIVSNVERSGGTVLYDITHHSTLGIPNDDTLWVQINGDYYLPVWVLNLLGRDVFADIRGLDLSRSTYPDSKMIELAHLRAVHDLQLGKLQATDIGLAQVKRLPINDLWICNSKVSATHVDHLKTLTQLQTLVFANSQVAEQSLRDLKIELPNCQVCF